MNRITQFSGCRLYRYSLWRSWGEDGAPFAAFIGLNPSTADETLDDPTIRRCVDYSKRWGFGALCMLNLFAYRATDPNVMKAAPEPVGASNDLYISTVARQAGVVVAAWGVHGVHRGRADYVIRLPMLKGKLSCLSRTKDGHPGHPLYLKKSLQPSPFA